MNDCTNKDNQPAQPVPDDFPGETSSKSNNKRNNLTMQYLHKQQIDGIVDHITDIYRSHPSTKYDIEQALIDNVFMVTKKFDGVDLRGLVNQSHSRPFQVELKTNGGWNRSLQQTGQRQANPPLHLYLDAFERFNRYLLMQSFGPNFVRKRRFQPLSYAFIDFPGSRGRRDNGERISRATLLNLGRLHIHAVVAVRPDEGQRCIQPLRHMLNGFDDELKKFGDIRINHYDPNEGLFNLVDYCSKGAQAVDDRYAWGDMYQVFPPERGARSSSKATSVARRNPSGHCAPKAVNVRGKQRFLLGQKLGHYTKMIR